MAGECFDALVIGGGPAGSTTALLLARAGWSVALVERSAFPRRKVCGEYLSVTNWPLLERLGVASECRDEAGPAVRRVGLFAGNDVLTAELPRGEGPRRGKSLSREFLDTALLTEARRAGVIVHQPATATALVRRGDSYGCAVRSGTEHEIRSRIVVAAHGSWQPGTLPTQPPRRRSRSSDLLGFKATFTDSPMPDDLMPLLSFRGGYGGMVMGRDLRLSVSCCVRRDVLQALRGGKHQDAGEVVESYLMASSRGVREALSSARRLGPWLAAGPIRTGVRPLAGHRIFRVGNAAGEAHPAVAEGISMAMQGAWLLADHLTRHRKAYGEASDWRACEASYARSWRRAFLPRLRAAALIAWWAQSPGLVKLTLPVFRRWPALLTWCAHLTGKDHSVVPEARSGVRHPPTLAEAT